MNQTIKSDKPKPEVKSEEPKKSAAALEDKQLDEVAGGSLYQACVTGKHIAGGKITT